MSKLITPLFFTPDLGFCRPAAGQMHWPTTTWPPMSEASYTMAKQNADAQYEIDKDAFSSLSGNAKDIGVAKAKDKHDIARADVEAAYENTVMAHQNARVAHAHANHNIAIEIWDDQTGNHKDICVQ